jgi:hypothetical protein
LGCHDPSAQLETITMPMTWVNSMDDVINPWNHGVAGRQGLVDLLARGGAEAE